MNPGSVFSAGARSQCVTPLSSANSLYSISISSRVSMCSLTKLTGTTIKLRTCCVQMKRKRIKNEDDEGR